ncbi:hypothetical protein NW766_009301 [Fusarium irregulare]|uniref:F-box domain protein n=1 Tax=Fusarium irregulare TaxID=2494466 RepID=A0A9W8PIL3_9HYPO|nr:hypothetical protein NW766_009301 [Fusarium irregulare]
MYRDIDDKQWNGGTFPAFTSAMDRLIELPNVTSVCIQFHDSCIGRRRNNNGEIEDNDEYYIDQDDAGDFKELPGTRRRFLEAIFAAIDKRATNPQNSTISSLTIFNLQNLASQGLCVSQLSKHVMRNITKLHLYIIEEALWEGDHYEVDLYRLERQTYEPFLQTAILPVLSSQLTYLNLRFRQHWGTAPGYFDGRDLMLPHLKTLVLGNFVISHRHHLDWVLAQTGLRRLRFEDCRILRNFTVRDESANTWGLRTHDWLFAPNTVDGRENPEDDEVTYLYPGTWDQVFQDIKQSLSRLIDIQVELRWYGPCFKGKKPLLPYDGYISFREGHRPPWDSTHSDFDWQGKYCLDLARQSWRARKLRDDPIHREESERFARESYERDIDSLSLLLKEISSKA